jgi:hypothetical protein
MDAPDLIIPIRMEVDKALKALLKISNAGKKAGEDVDAGAKKGKKGLDDLEDGADSATRSLLNMGRAQMALSMIKAVGTEISKSFKDAADYVRQLADEFATLRKSMAELAELSGKSTTTEFTLEQAKRAQQYGMSIEENRIAQETFKNFAGSQVGDEVDAAGKSTGRVAKGAKLTEAQGEEFSGRVAQHMKASSQKPERGMNLAGAMLQQAKGPQDVNKLMKDFTEAFAISQKGPVDVKEMIPELQGIMSYGVSGQDAAKMFNIVAPVGRPGEAGISAESAMKAIQEMKNTNKGLEFGVKRGMGQMEAVRAFAANIAGRKQKMTSAGMTDQQAFDELEAMLDAKKIVPDVRQARGLVRGFAGQGMDLGGFTQYDEIHRMVAPDLEKTKRADYLQSEQGVANAETTAQEVARAERGAKYQRVRAELEKGKTQVIRSGELEEPSLSRTLRSNIPFSSVDYQQQLINREALTNVGRRAAAAGVKRDVGETEFDPNTASGRQSIAIQSVGDQASVNKRIEELLDKIEKNTGGKPAAVPIPLSMPKTVRNAGGPQ